MARWGMRGMRGMRAGAVVAALSLAIAGLTGLPATSTTLEDPPVPPAEPQITATYNGTEILNCLGQQVCPEIAVAGEPVTFTITTTSPNVVKQRYTFNSNPVDVDGSNLTLSLTPTKAALYRLDVQSFDDLGQASPIARFLINVGPRPRPIGSWSFDDGSGTTAADTATPAHPLTLANGAAFDGKGRSPDRWPSTASTTTPSRLSPWSTPRRASRSPPGPGRRVRRNPA